MTFETTRMASVPYRRFSTLPGALNVKMYARPSTMPGIDTGKMDSR